jgi:hypothetical protein
MVREQYAGAADQLRFAVVALQAGDLDALDDVAEAEAELRFCRDLIDELGGALVDADDLLA